MEIDLMVAELEAALANQVRLGGDPVVDEAADALLAALQPAVLRLVTNAAEQAAAEVDAQLPDRSVRVMLSEGRPTLVVGTEDPSTPIDTTTLEARVTLRLPDMLKEYVEAAAGESGESVNTYVVKALDAQTRARSKASGGRFQGTIET